MPSLTVPKQGVSWFLRKALPYAKVTLYIHVYPNSVAPNIYHLDVDPVITGGIKGTKEAYKLDWIPREHVDDIFGTVNTKWRSFGSTKGDDGKVHPAVQVQTVLDSPEDNFKVQEFLNGIILADGSATEGFTLDGASKGLYIQGFVENKRNGWTSEEVCTLFSYSESGNVAKFLLGMGIWTC